MLNIVVQSLPQTFVVYLLCLAGFDHTDWQFWAGNLLFFLLDITSNIFFAVNTYNKET